MFSHSTTFIVCVSIYICNHIVYLFRFLYLPSQFGDNFYWSVEQTKIDDIFCRSQKNLIDLNDPLEFQWDYI